MKRLILILAISFVMGYAFIPFVASDSLLKLYPWPQSITISPPPCKLNVLQDTIQLVFYGPSDTIREAAKVCSMEIQKAFYHAIDFSYNKNDSTKPIKAIIDTLRPTIPPPPDNQKVQILFIFGTKGTALVHAALDSLQADGLQVTENDIPNNDEGYLLAGKTRNWGNKKRLLVVCAGNTNIGCFRGASTLRELIAQHYQGLLPSSIIIRDWPDIAWREVGWQGSELGDPDTLHPKHIAKLDYLSLLKCNLVEHENHKSYYSPYGYLLGKNPGLGGYPASYINDYIKTNWLDSILVSPVLVSWD